MSPSDWVWISMCIVTWHFLKDIIHNPIYGHFTLVGMFLFSLLKFMDRMGMKKLLRHENWDSLGSGDEPPGVMDMGFVREGPALSPYCHVHQAHMVLEMRCQRAEVCEKWYPQPSTHRYISSCYSTGPTSHYIKRDSLRLSRGKPRSACCGSHGFLLPGSLHLLWPLSLSPRTLLPWPLEGLSPRWTHWPVLPALLDLIMDRVPW